MYLDHEVTDITDHSAAVARIKCRSRLINRKVLHIVAGVIYLMVADSVFIQRLSPIVQAALPLTFLLLYLVVSVTVPEVTALLEACGNSRSAGVVEYICLCAAFPFVKARHQYKRSLLCLFGGDGLSAFATAGPRLFYNNSKSYPGLLLHIFGAYTLVAIHFRSYPAVEAVMLATVSAVIEGLPTGGHDNVAVVIGTYFYQHNQSKACQQLGVIVFMFFLYQKKKFTYGAALAGIVVLYTALVLDLRIFVSISLFGVLGTLSSALKQKYMQGENTDSQQEVRQGRNAAQVLQNSLASLFYGALYKMFRAQFLLQSAIVCSAECMADTWASDLGQIFNGDVYTAVGFKKVGNGFNGGVSLAGSGMGLLGSAVISMICLRGSSMKLKLLTTTVGFAGCYLDSIIGLLFQASYDDVGKNIGGRDWLSNGSVNLLSSFVTGLVGCGIFYSCRTFM